MEIFYLFLGAACALVMVMLGYVFIPHLNSATTAGPRFGQGRGAVLEENSDFKLVLRTTELILVPVTTRAAEFLNRSPDATAPYYRAIIVERANLLNFAEHCLAAGLTLALRHRAS